MNLTQAHTEWATRPPEERFWTLQEMHEAVYGHRRSAAWAKTHPQLMRVVALEGNGLALNGKTAQASMGHFAFNQLSTLCDAPAGYLRKLPSPIVADALNAGLAHRRGEVSLLLNRGENLSVRAITSTRYARIWNSDITQRLMPLLRQAWRVPPARPAVNDPRARPATESDCLNHRMPGLGIHPGDEIAPAGLYASDKDMFAFLVNEERPIQSGKSILFRGVFVENSEVGDRCFRLTSFLYNSVCGNHIVWGSSRVNQVRIVHIGKANDSALDALEGNILEYSEASDNETRSTINRAKELSLGPTKPDVMERLAPKKLLPQTTLEAAYDAAVQHPEDGANDPGSVWGMVQGITRLSQQLTFTDERVSMDRAAGKLLEMAF